MSPNKTETFHNLQLWNSGDSNGLNALLERHLPWIRAHVRKRLGPILRQKAETSDFVQDAMIQFLRYGPRVLISDEQHFRALLVKIIENTLRDKHDWYTACRRRVARERPLPSDTVLSLDPPDRQVKRPSQAAHLHENEAWIRLGLELLEPKDREVLVLRQWENESFVDIGKRLGLSPEAVWKRHHRALNQLSIKVGDLRRKGITVLLENTLDGNFEKNFEN
jgi:RNA polymerase sigma factor (sigma-70 family)